MEKLTKAEEEVMQIIWILKRCTVSQILDYLETEKQIKRPAHSTISTFVRILEKKGFVNHKAYGRTYEYFPVIPREDYSKKTLSSLLKDYFGGSPRQLVSFLVKENDLSLEEMSDLLDELENDQNHQD